jgi:Pyruvate/2-oxoacid:ferredoxin oxidoreductase delta subunit
VTAPVKIVFCDCRHAQVAPLEARNAVLRHLLQAGVEFEAVGDLCELAARHGLELKRMAANGQVHVAACFPRAVHALFAVAGVSLVPAGLEVLNLKTPPSPEALARLTVAGNGIHAPDAKIPSQPRKDPPHADSNSGALLEAPPFDGDAVLVALEPEIELKLAEVRARLAQGQRVVAGPGGVIGIPVLPQDGWLPWFPVIDFDRCTHCLQCLSFCLFGVFGTDAQGQIEVQSPVACKANCPACSRVCPEAAIIFPKHPASPINGDEPKEGAERETMKVDVSALLGGDVYAQLRSRSERAGGRFSADRDAAQAQQERLRWLTKFARLGDIPPEVLAALPSQTEIQQRAAEAKAKVQAVLEKRDKDNLPQ